MIWQYRGIAMLVLGSLPPLALVAIAVGQDLQATTEDQAQTLTSIDVTVNGRSERWAITYDRARNHLTGNVFAVMAAATPTPEVTGSPGPTSTPGSSFGVSSLIDCAVTSIDPGESEDDDDDLANLDCKLFDGTAWKPLENVAAVKVADFGIVRPTPSPVPTAFPGCFAVGGHAWELAIRDSCGFQDWRVVFREISPCQFFAEISERGDGRPRIRLDSRFADAPQFVLTIEQPSCSGNGDFTGHADGPGDPPVSFTFARGDDTVSLQLLE
jgi:hypothetical protein